MLTPPNKIANVDMKNYSIEFWRFFFMLFICLTHFPGKTVIHLHHAYLAVDFFFILSGLFIYKSSCKQNPLSTFDFTWNKIKRFYPKLVLGCILMTLLQPTWLHHTESLEEIAVEWQNFINELCFVMNIGVFGGGKNPPVWYLSSLIVGGSFLYSFLTYNRKLSLRIFFPIILMIVTFIFGKGSNVDLWGVEGWFYRPLLRGIAGMGIGILLGHFLQFYKDRISISFVNITSLLSVFGILLIMFLETNFDSYIFLLSPFVIMACFYKDSLIYKYTSMKFFSKLGEISYDMLILHCVIINAYVLINRYMHLSYSIPILIAYLVIVVCCAFVLNRVFKSFHINS